MNYLMLILGGAVIGVIVAAPIGPVNLICMRRTIVYGPLNGFLAGLGAACGDGIFAIVAAFGLTAVSQLIEGYSPVLKLIGGTLLISFGIRIFRTDVSALRDEEGLPIRDAGPSSLVRAALSTFALTITNPATMFGFAALFTGLGAIVGGDATFLAAAVTVAGVVAGSAGWWFTVSTVTGILHHRITPTTMHRINEVSGIAVAGFGVVVLGSLVYTLLR